MLEALGFGGILAISIIVDKNMSRIDTLTNKEPATEEVSQKMLIIGALHLPTESDGVDVATAPEKQERRDWNKIVEAMYLDTEEVICKDFLCPNEEGLVVSPLEINPSNHAYFMFTITASEFPDRDLITIYINKKQLGINGWTQYMAQKLKNSIAELLDSLESNAHPRSYDFTW